MKSNRFTTTQHQVLEDYFGISFISSSESVVAIMWKRMIEEKRESIIKPSAPPIKKKSYEEQVKEIQSALTQYDRFAARRNQTTNRNEDRYAKNVYQGLKVKEDKENLNIIDNEIDKD